ncbi:unnamed protein product, partial [Ectocarpus sp. 12 AP-2014]
PSRRPESPSSIQYMVPVLVEFSPAPPADVDHGNDPQESNTIEVSRRIDDEA